MLTHDQCLTTFLNTKVRKQRIKPTKLRCQICASNYEVSLLPTCTFSLEHCRQKISSGRLRCSLFSLFFLVVILFYALMAFLFVARPLSDVARVVFVIVAVCLFLLFVLFFTIWLYEYLFRIECDNIGRVLTVDQQNGSKLIHHRLSRSVKIHPESTATLQAIANS